MHNNHPNRSKVVIVRALGGTTFEANGVRFESGIIDADGQWQETEDLEEAARREANIKPTARVELPF